MPYRTDSMIAVDWYVGKENYLPISLRPASGRLSVRPRHVRASLDAYPGPPSELSAPLPLRRLVGNVSVTDV